MGKLRRRDFLAISSTTFASAIWSRNSSSDNLVSEFTGRYEQLQEGERTPTFCEICFWKCAGWTIKDKAMQPWKIIGNDIDVHSNGRLCTRGSAGMGSYLDDDRLKSPLIRVEQNGKQEFKEVSWDEALQYIADKLKGIKEEHGPEKVAMFKHGIGATFFETLLEGYGTQMFTHPSYAQCRGARLEAFKLTFGEGVGSPERTDMENSRCLVLMGSHLGENLHNSQVQEFGKAIERDCHIITVDPRFSVAASKSKHWLPIKPGTDMALVLAWIHVLIEEGIYHKQFVELHCEGFDELKEHVKLYTPEWAYPITSIRPEVIRETARHMAMNKPATIVHPSRHVSWDGNDTQRLRSIAILNALLGNWGQKGGLYYTKQVKVPKYPIPEPPPPAYGWRDLLEDKYPFASTPPSNAIRDLTLEGHFKAWFIYATNIMQSLPNQDLTRKAIEKLDMLVVIDTMPAEIVGLADVVLPECTYLERYDDLRVTSAKRAQVAIRAPAFPPKWNTKPAWWIAKQLSKKMSLEAYFPWEDIEEYLDYRLKGIGSSLQDLLRKGVIEPVSTSSNYVPIEYLKFRTRTGKVELKSQVLQDFGFDAFPTFRAQEEPPEGFYRLLYGRSPAHTFGKTVNNPILNQLMPENEVWVNAHVAGVWGLKNGEYVQLKNLDDVVSQKIKVKVTQQIRGDAVYMVHGFGHRAEKLSRAHGKGADDQALMTRIPVDPIMGSTGFRTNFVTFVTS